MARSTNTLEGGAEATTVTTGNSGGTSGTAFTLVTIPAGGTATYAAASAKNGTRGLRLATGSAAGPYVQHSFTAAADFSVQCWWKFDAAPAAAVEGPMLLRVSAGTSLIRLTFSTSRRLQITDGVGSSTQAPVMTAGVWYYLDWYGTGLNGAAGAFSLDIYNADGTLFGSSGSFTGRTTAALAGRAEWGTHSTVTGLVHHFDDVTADIAAGVDAGGFPTVTAAEYILASGLLDDVVATQVKIGGVLV